MNILVAIDFSDVTDKVIDYVMTHFCTSDNEILLIHVADPAPDFIGYEPGPQEEREFIAKQHHKEHEKIRHVSNKLQSVNANVLPLLLQGPAAEKILLMSVKHSIELVVLGSHGHGYIHKLFVGSITEAVIKESACPVLIIPCRERNNAYD